MTPDDVELQLLIGEKEHADKQIDSFLDLQMKLLGTTVVALAAAAGWIFAQKGGDGTPQKTAIASVIGSFLLSAALLQTVVTYGTALGYIYYKQEMLGPALAGYCRSKLNPLMAGDSWRESPSMPPVIMAAGILFLLSVSAALALGIVGFSYAPRSNRGLRIAAIAALIVAGLVGVCLAWNMVAMWRIQLAQQRRAEAAGHDANRSD